MAKRAKSSFHRAIMGGGRGGDTTRDTPSLGARRSGNKHISEETGMQLPPATLHPQISWETKHTAGHRGGGCQGRNEAQC